MRNQAARASDRYEPIVIVETGPPPLVSIGRLIDPAADQHALPDGCRLDLFVLFVAG
jgi:hypothetical protein